MLPRRLKMSGQAGWIRKWVVRLLVLSLLSTVLFMYCLTQVEQESQINWRHSQDVGIVRRDILKAKALTAEDDGVIQERLDEIRKEILSADRPRPPDSVYNLNVTLSDRLPLRRDVPDARSQDCKRLVYDRDKLPNVTVIMPFYNEALSMLLRAIHALLDRTPSRLLVEIILIDDASKNEDLKEPLTKYIRLLKKVRLVRSIKREGLIRARMLAASLATGEVIIFHDAHTEVNHGWVEPILQYLKDNPHSVVQPAVDEIDQWTIAYRSGADRMRGGFGWDMKYVWMATPEFELKKLKTFADAYRTPTLVGCAIAVTKKYFQEIGGFDEGLNIWGGENIELAFRVWLCGGSVMTVPCAHVGHVFKPFSYSFDGDKEKIVAKNIMRVAELWMGPYRRYMYAATRAFDYKRVDFTPRDIALIRSRKTWITDRHKCKSFDWFLNNIIPEHNIPPLNAKNFGEVMNTASRACLEVDDHGYIVMTYDCYYSRVRPENEFALYHDGRLKLRDKCVTLHYPSLMLTLQDCDMKHIQTFWDLNPITPSYGNIVITIIDRGVERTLCIEQVTAVVEPLDGKQAPQATICRTENNAFQLWTFSYALDYSHYP
ncbi:polypeptide N-acetylgalactosaminyltransferase 1 [Lingula anatina]|uniref:Polypeptide N-acetylgalactosaminyltransferase n=1 Tax=Lingula anatina TaxID=7574 RepID=A0A1S3JZC8_LINAN|nr:polypeptide N-acetylgalactosaminyltransferase 1 [Lingula anatina]|eukprot:XP_013415753.1 polypeptide N-acetylgalactosaminyltransferase 1 [Lingula anatina]